MQRAITSVISAGEMYERLQALAAEANLPILQLAAEAGITPTTLYQMKSRAKKGAMWTTKTLNSISSVLAKRLNRRASDVYAQITGLEDPETSPTSASSSARGRRSVPAR